MSNNEPQPILDLEQFKAVQGYAQNVNHILQVQESTLAVHGGTQGRTNRNNESMEAQMTIPVHSTNLMLDEDDGKDKDHYLMA